MDIITKEELKTFLTRTTTTEGDFLYGHNNQGGIKDLSNPISWLVRLAVYAYASARARN
jgi:hypothetical protein